jgi:hypothetical protein
MDVTIDQAGNYSAAFQVAHHHTQAGRKVRLLRSDPEESLSAHQEVAKSPGLRIVQIGVPEQFHQSSTTGELRT